MTELESSVRLSGGKRKLVERIREESADLGVRQLAWAPTSLAAVAVARSGASNGFGKPLEQVLDALPLHMLTQVSSHHATLARLSCKTLGDVRKLPRGGVSRRFDAELLGSLDQAYGLRPEAHDWVELPDDSHMKLELMARIELAPAMLFGARRLLVQKAGWLAARHCAVTAFTLRWCHDAMRSKSAGDGGELVVCTAAPTRDIEHLTRLLAEHLARVKLLAPVGDLEMVASEVHSLEDKGLTLFREPQQAGESLDLVLERIAARLGPERVLWLVGPRRRRWSRRDPQRCARLLGGARRARWRALDFPDSLGQRRVRVVSARDAFIADATRRAGSPRDPQTGVAHTPRLPQNPAP